MKRIRGVVAPSIVPFTVDGDVDKGSLREYIEWLVGKKVNCLFILGSFGGGPLMTTDERKMCAEIVVDTVQGRIPVICHIGSSDTRSSIELAKHAEGIGVDAVSSLPPGYYKHTADAIVGYFQDLLSAVAIPVFVYNNPGAVGYNIEPHQLAKLADLGVKGIKDSSFNLIYLQKAMNAVGSREFVWINGTAPLMLASLMLGADACVLGPANAFPEEAVNIWEAVQRKDFETASSLQKRMMRIVEAMTIGTDVVGIHTMLELRGFTFGGFPRAPLKPLAVERKEELRKQLIDLDLL